METESKLLGISLRGWLSLLVTLTVCLMSSSGVKIEEPLYSLSIMTIGFYFGQKTNTNGGAKNGSI